jgi:hypothetical protein
MGDYPVINYIYANFSLLFGAESLYKYSTMNQNLDQILNDLKSALATSPVSSAGISDTASRQQMSINDNGVALTKLRVDRVLGDLTVENKTVTAEVVTGKISTVSLTASGDIVANTIRAKRVITEQDQDSYNNSITFYGENRQALDGKGLLFSHPEFTHQFIFKTDKIFTTENIDLYRGKSYQINGVPVIEEGKLSDSITQSNLTSIGTLSKLKVSNAAQVGQTLFVNDAYNRISINTEQMFSALTIVEGGATIVLGGDETTGAGRIGTWGPNRLSLITDNTDRISIQGNNVIIGNAKSKNAEVAINGELKITGDLYVGGTMRIDNLISDTRMQRSSSLEFVSDETESVYGKGLKWKGESHTRWFTFSPNFDRLLSSENIDLITDRAYYINKVKVIDAEGLGESIKHSSLTTVGTLQGLNVQGAVSVQDHLEVGNGAVTVTRPFNVKDATGDLNLTANKFETTSRELSIIADKDKILSVNNLGNLELGSKERTDRSIHAYGKLSVNISNPDPDVDLQVNGIFSFGGKKFVVATKIPETGFWMKGDIAWNSLPEDTGFIGWVCIVGGKPGEWRPFGYIGK